MARLEMHNSNNAARISFSNEFVEIKSEKTNSNTNNINSRNSFSNHSPDFEFSVKDYSMIPADEIFLKGKILPLKETSQVHKTLREELLVEEKGNIFSFRPMLLSSSSSSFTTKGMLKELLGLKRSQVRSKKSDKINEEDQICSPSDHNIFSGNVAMRKCQVGDRDHTLVFGN